MDKNGLKTEPEGHLLFRAQAEEEGSTKEITKE